MNNNQFELFLKHIRLIRIKLKKLQKLVDERKKEITKIENYIERSKQIEELKSKINNKSKIKRTILSKLLNRKEKQGNELEEENLKRHNDSIKFLEDSIKLSQTELNVESRRLTIDFELKEELDKTFLNKAISAEVNYSIKELIENETKQFVGLTKLYKQYRELLEAEQSKSRLINKTYLSETTKEKVEEVNNLFDKEIELISTIKKILKLLEHEYEQNKLRAKEISREESIKLKNMGLKHDLLKYGREAGYAIKKEIYKTKAATEYLNMQRRLHEGLGVNKLIAVHITNYFPKNGIIKTLLWNKLQPRETIHFTLNGTVGDHESGEWNNVKYGILIDLKKMIDRVINISPMDTFIMGNLKLPPGSEIWVPRSEQKYEKQLEKLKGNAKIFYYNDKRDLRKEIIPNRIREKGYSVSTTGKWGWGSLSEVPKEVEEYLTGMTGSNTFENFANKIGKYIGSHSDTSWGHLEIELLTLNNYLFGQENLEKNNDKNEIKKVYLKTISIKEILDKVKKQFPFKEEKEALYRIEEYMKKIINYIEKEFPSIIREINKETTKSEKNNIKEKLLFEMKEFKQIINS